MEVVPFGLLVFVVGALLVANVWAVIDAKFATGAAAREAARAYVEAPSADVGSAAAVDAAREAIAAYGKVPGRLDLVGSGSSGFGRCDRVSFAARYRVAAIALPFGIGIGAITVTSRHSEIIDPLRSGLGPGNSCGY